MPEIEWKGGQHQYNYRKLASDELEDYARLYAGTVGAEYSAEIEFELLKEIQNFTTQIMNNYYEKKE